jgi:adhesin/invasin
VTNVRTSRRLLPFAPLVGALLLAQCGGSDITLPSEGQPAKLSIVSGDGQSARVGAALPAPLVVRVTDSKDRPVSGTPITFTVASGPVGTAVAPAATQTGDDGRGQAGVQLGTGVGNVVVSAKVTGSQDPALAVAFHASAISADANAITAVSGDGQSAPVGTALPAPLVVQVADGFGNPIAGVTVTWTAGGGGSVSATTTTTGADGRAQVTRTLGPTAGTQTTDAAAAGLAGSPVRFTSNALAGGAATLKIVSGNNQSGPVSTALPQPLVVQLVDADGNGVPGRAVSWVVAPGSGSATPPTSTTGPDGTASTQWTLGPNGGTNTLSAVVSGIGVAAFTATANAPPPPPPPPSPRLAMATQPSNATISGSRLAQQPVVQLTDASGQPIAKSGVVVVAAIGSGGGTLGGDETKSTDGSGKATFTDLSITGSGTATLAFSASGYSSVTSSAIQVVPPGPSQSGSTIAASPGSITTTGTSTVTVTVKDNLGNPLAGASVTFSAQGGSVQPGSATTNAQGVATTTFTPSGTGTAQVGAAVTASGVTVNLSSSISVGQAPPAQIVANSAAPSGTVGGTATPAPSVKVTDGAGQPVAGVTVVFTVTGGGGSVTGGTQTTDASGVATVGGWTLGTDATQTNTLSAQAQADGVSGNPVTFTATVAAAAASQLGFLTEPSPSVRVDRNIKPAVTVAVQDRFGNVVKGATDPVTLALTGGSADARLSGNGPATPVNGVASFSSLKVSVVGSGYQLVANAAGLQAATSTAFTVTQ